MVINIINNEKMIISPKNVIYYIKQLKLTYFGKLKWLSLHT